MKSFRVIFLLLLSLGLSLGEASASYMQAQMAGSRSLTICSPDGTREIQLGANGKPVSSGKHKHSCCLFATNAVSPAGASFLPRTIRSEPAVIRTGRSVRSCIEQPARARSPPQ